MVENAKNVEGVKRDFHAKFVEKKSKKVGGLGGFFTKGPASLASISHGYLGYPI